MACKRNHTDSSRGGRPTARRGGFTLVELLVVIAIIALLVSILMPALQKAQELARIAVCMANEKSLGLAFQQYAAENDGSWPWFFNNFAAEERFGGGGPTYNGYTWAMMVYMYAQNPDMYACVSFDGGTGKPGHGFYNGQEYLTNSQYKANAYLGTPPGWVGPSEWKFGTQYGGTIDWQHPVGTWTFYPAKDDRIVNAASKVLLYDNFLDWSPYGPTPGRANHFGWTGSAGDGDRSNIANYGAYWQKPHIGLWHGDKANFAFTDGHAETLDREDPRCYGKGSDDVDRFDEQHWMFYK